MITNTEYEKLAHNLKRAAKVVKFIHDEENHDKRQTLLSLLVDEMDRMGTDLFELKETKGQ